jgi:RNA polymerase sigma-70 factor (ECF subfamily)
LVARYSRGISIIIRREVSNAAAAEDLYQETFRTALEKVRRGDLREPEKLSGFICSLASNCEKFGDRLFPAHGAEAATDRDRGS